MRLLDISRDQEPVYRLNKNEQVIFFMLNRDGEITFELTHEGARAHIFAFFTGTGTDQKSLTLSQKHLAPRTTSRALVKSVLAGRAEFHYTGSIHIEPAAEQSKAAQESRGLLLSQDAHMTTRPALEILADDVECRHAATVSPLSETALFYAKSRGLSRAQARALLIGGFFGEALEELGDLGPDTAAVRALLSSSIETLYV